MSVAMFGFCREERPQREAGPRHPGASVVLNRRASCIALSLGGLAHARNDANSVVVTFRRRVSRRDDASEFTSTLSQNLCGVRVVCRRTHKNPNESLKECMDD